MVIQGHIIKLNFNPQCGHEQAGFRPALVISNEIYHKKTNLAVVCPITSTMRNFPLQIPLDNRTNTSGMILCQHVKALDIQTRTYQIVELLPEDLLEKVIYIVQSQVDRMF